MTATLTKTETPVREDGVSGYAVSMDGPKETSTREPVEIVTTITQRGIELGMDRVVTLHVEAVSNRIAVFSERGTEMITHICRVHEGVTVVMYPSGHPEAPANAIAATG